MSPGSVRSKPTRALTTPRPIGSAVPIDGRIGRCARLLGPGDRLLDVGCSSGWLSDIAIRNGYREYVGLDRIIVGDGAPIPGARYLSGSAFALPFDNEAFDAVAIFDVIQELPKHAEVHALREAQRVLRPGGTLYLSAPHANALHTPLDPVWYLGRHHYGRRALAKLLTTAGFRIESMTVGGGTVEILNHLALWLSWHAFRRTPPVPSWIDRRIEQEYGRDRHLGHTIFVVASRP